MNLRNLKHMNPGYEWWEDYASSDDVPGFGPMDIFALLNIISALKLQESGIKLNSRLPQGTTMARKSLGLSGDRKSLLAQCEEIYRNCKQLMAQGQG